MSLKRSIRLSGLVLVVSGFCVLLTVLPYKRYMLVPLFGGGGADGSESILSLLQNVFTGSFDPGAFLATLPFLAIFSPLVILAELTPLSKRAPGRTFFLFQGILLLCSALWMLWIMTIGFLEYNVKLLPTFYGVLCWVMVPAVCSFMLTSRQMQNGFRRFIA